MSNPKEYNIDSFDKLCNVVNPENSERLAIDLAQWLMFYSDAIRQLRDQHPEETKGKSNTEIAKGAFKWVDDGKNDLLGMTVENMQTGEVHNKAFQPSSEPNVQVCDATKDDQGTKAGKQMIS